MPPLGERAYLDFFVTHGFEASIKVDYGVDYWVSLDGLGLQEVVGGGCDICR